MSNIVDLFKKLTYTTTDSPLTEEELCIFEKNHDIQIPAEYRDFLKYIANGVTFSNGEKIYGIKRPAEKTRFKRLYFNFLLKDGYNKYFSTFPKPYPKFDGSYPQYEDCIDIETHSEKCHMCNHYNECLDSEFDDVDIYDPEDSPIFNGCYEIFNKHYLIMKGCSKNQIWISPECDAGVMQPKYNSFSACIIYLANL